MSSAAGTDDRAVEAQPTLMSGAQRNVVFVTILLGLLLSALDQTIVSSALPTIVGGLGGSGHLSWTAWLSEQLSRSVAGQDASPVEPGEPDDRVRAALRRIAQRIVAEEPREPRLPELATASN